METSETHLLTIGDLARLTGISVHVLRKWEKRYGAPQSIRLSSGHRRYAEDEMFRLKLVKRAVDGGSRPSQAVSATLDQLSSILAEGVSSGKLDLQLIQKWIDAARRFDGNTLNSLFQREWTHRGSLRFMDECVVPFLKLVGDYWQDKVLCVAHEHFASEQLNDFLRFKWRAMNVHVEGRPFVLTSFPGNQHGMALHMCAILIVQCGYPVTFLGNDLPLEEIPGVIASNNARALLLSISSKSNKNDAKKGIQYLLKNISSQTQLVVGGTGAPHKIAKTLFFYSFDDFFSWLQSLS